MRLKHFVLLAAAAAVIVAAAEPALAKSSLGIGTAEASGLPGGGPFGGLLLQINVWQRQFLMLLNKSLVAIRNGSGGTWILVGISFAYGVFHAAGPGHGKAVISSYVLADRVQLRRGIGLSFASAALQAAMAILVSCLGWFALRGTGLSMTAITGWLETASFALVAGFGAWLLLRKLVSIARRPRRTRIALDFAAPVPAFRTSGGALAFAGPAAVSAGPIMRPASGALTASETCDEDDENCGCGRAHIADPSQLSGNRFTFANAVSTVFAIGLRPCWGAVSVMAFALVNGLYLGGVLSVLAVSLGTAITVSLIAAFAVFAKGLAMRLGRASGRGTLVMDVLEIAGASIVLAMGLLLLGGALI
ncbi:nickel/cobalt transporter [Aureimonas leprariae]|uniref:Nickel/cobalt efflux system n=1 Tax=Plantimonas leprariae TaxID=2615207 RepID=A0A7V7PPQ9_9HYPH|nr:nickel/cobalt transporter [Aureimonas leprariae]KAB0680019.1 nickel/cobalt transporter [Aureimonas leprariae]